MDDAHKKDVVLSHRIINYLRAGYQGESTYLRALRELGSPEVADEVLARLEGNQQRIEQWYQAIPKGDCLFSAAWKTPQTFEAKKALEWLDALRSISEKAAGSLRDSLANGEWKSSKDKTRRMAANLARYGYVTKVYSLGMIDLANHTADQAAASQYANLVEHGSAEVARVVACVAVVKERGLLPAELHAHFINDARRASWGLASEAHDIVQILAPYKGGDAYIASSLGASVQDWTSIGIGALEAGYWQAFGFTPKAADQWIRGNVRLPGVAAAWNLDGFLPEAAAQWISVSVSPDEARAWEKAGTDFEQAASFIKKGYRTPSELPKGE